MKRAYIFVVIITLLSQACSPGALTGKAADVPIQNQPAPQDQGRCGDGTCGGPENANICPQDCSAGAVPGGDKQAPVAKPASQDGVSTDESEIMVGVVEAEITVDRSPGAGDCGIEPWYSSDCTGDMKVWWEMQMTAHASTPVLIVPDGQDRWVITSEQDAAAKYGINLADYDATSYTGEYTSISINPAATNPECSASIEGPDFDFEVMGTREEGLTVLTLSANPVEKIRGSCGQAKFDYETRVLFDDWAYALTGDAGQLSFQLNDTFYDAPGTYNYEVTLDTNPSPEKRDHVTNRLTLLCMAEEAPGVRAPAACPWEK
ncbi:MAG: hypothetical protein AB9891_05720 [Anaerolineaceae bacterium]